MCLIAIAHGVSPRFPLVIAANRDEDYERPSRPAHFWEDAPHVLGGRDAVAGGSWLGVDRSGRFAAVTNLRGAVLRSRSRGMLVRDFLSSATDPAVFAEAVVREGESYSAFHLLLGSPDELVYATPEFHSRLESGVYAITNAPNGEEWPKATIAAVEMQVALSAATPEELLASLMTFMTTSRGATELESEVFIAGERYGTRASTVIIATPGEIVFAERNFGKGGETLGEMSLFRFGRK